MYKKRESDRNLKKNSISKKKSPYFSLFWKYIGRTGGYQILN